MISSLNLCKHYANQVIFENVTFNINPRERVGLVGRNGHGKTTLFKLLTGQEEADDGNIAIPKDYRLGYLNQNIHFTKLTVLEEGCCGLPDDRKSDEWRVEKILTGLGFLPSDFDRSPDEFSGGYQVRLNLAKVLVSNPDLLLLDEPTNFLDIISIRWLIKFLNLWPNELIIISHDRNFMDSVATHIMGIHRSKLKKIAGPTKNYYDQITKEEILYEKERLNNEKKRKHTELFITKFRAKARQANLVQSRVKSLEKQDVLKKLDSIAEISFSFNEAQSPPKYMLEARDISFSYNEDQPYLIEDLSFSLECNDRICIVGKNGKGKTTLLKLLAGYHLPVKGDIKSHPLTKKAYFEQANTAKLNDDLTIEDEILSSYPEIGRKLVRDVCGAMMFSGDTALKKIGVLSGGEKCRVLFGKLFITPSNTLLLDEPTHHLDMQSAESLIEAVKSFSGAAVIVTHNEYMLRKLANKLIVFQKDRVFLYRGGYTQFIDEVGWGDEEESITGDQPTQQIKDKSDNSKRKDKKKTRAEFITKRSKTLKPYKTKIEDTEKKIELLEKQHHDETQLLIEASQNQDANKITTLSKAIKETQSTINELYELLETTSDEYEKMTQQFEEEEKNL